jgi:hypothetical protein
VTAADRRPHTESGYFDDAEKLTQAAASISQAKGIYFIPNPLNPALLARAVNKIRPAPKGESTQDGDITRRHWLLIDTDPVRPAHIASTDAEHQAALDRATAIASSLTAAGWVTPIVADSGNGGHLLYRIDLPTDDEELVKRCLQALAAQFDDDAVKLDQGVFNPARIWKLYGTVAGKGDAEAAGIGRPHRMARILTAPETVACVPQELLEALAARAPTPPPKKTNGVAPKFAAGIATANGFDLAAWIGRHGLAVTGPEDWRDQSRGTGKRWVFPVCPWNSDHTNGSAYIVQFANGAIAAGCHHNSCSGNNWQSLRDKFEPDRRKPRCDTTAPGGATPSLTAPQINERLAAALAAGPECIFRDGPLLQELARLAEDDPAENACVRARLRAAGVRLREFDAVLAPLRAEVRRLAPPLDAAGCYSVSGGRIVRTVLTRDGPVEVPLATWDARIVEQTVRDDGAERHVVLAIEGTLADGTPLRRVEVAADQFATMRWPVAAWGTRAVVLAGAGTADHLRAAVQLLSGDVPTRTVYAQIGWREIDGKWVYLSASGAIGAVGRVAGIEVHLPDALAGYVLPDPPTGDQLTVAVRASLAILDVAPDRITVPLLGGGFRAVLGAADYSLQLCGPSGAGKTELAALSQQHHGAGLDARHLPGSWASTANSLEALAFAAADAILAVDDFAPQGSTTDIARSHREVDRLLRAQGNRSGRARCRTDGTVRPARPPRGTILSTGEDTPRGQSLRARQLILELAPGELDWSRLTNCQRDAAAGLYAQALAAFLQWLAPQYTGVREGLHAETAGYRERFQAEGLHARTPGILANLVAGWCWWLKYALAVGAINAAESVKLTSRVWEALLGTAAEQAKHGADAEPCDRFLRLIAAALASGRAHLAGPAGDTPDNGAAWGWREEPIRAGQYSRMEWQAHGRRIGWVDGANLYLEPEASYAEAQKLASEQGEALPIGARTLWQRLRERGLLASWDANRKRNTIRRRLGGSERREVIHLRKDALSPFTGSSPTSLPCGVPHQDPVGAGDNSGDDRGLDSIDHPQVDAARTVQNAIGDSGDGQAKEDTLDAGTHFSQTRDAAEAIDKSVADAVFNRPTQAT